MFLSDAFLDNVFWIKVKIATKTIEFNEKYVPNLRYTTTIFTGNIQTYIMS